MAYVVDFEKVSTQGLESSPANDVPAELAGTIRGSFFVIKGKY